MRLGSFAATLSSTVEVDIEPVELSESDTDADRYTCTVFATWHNVRTVWDADGGRSTVGECRRGWHIEILEQHGSGSKVPIGYVGESGSGKGFEIPVELL